MNSFNFLNVAYIYQKIFDFLSGRYVPDWNSVLAAFLLFLGAIQSLSALLALLFLTGIIYCSIRTRALMHELLAPYHAHKEGAHGAHAAPQAAPEPATNKRWEKIVEHVHSRNPSDWRLAILECDIILDEMLSKMSYRGETLSDKLKAVEKSDFLSIDKAWEAHRVRNAIAHEGSNFQITDREALRVVSLYEEVFKEFHYI